MMSSAKAGAVGGAYAALRIPMKSANETEIPIIVLLCVYCYKGQPL